LYASMYYALKDTRTPLKYAILRVFLTTVLGYVCALQLPPVLGLDPRWGVAGLTASAGICGWLEFVLLRNTMNQRIGKTGLPAQFISKLWVSAGAAAAAGWGGKLMMNLSHPIVLAIVSLGIYGVVYFIVARVFDLPEAERIIRSLFSFLRFFKRSG
jgi:putative peptidoglycan lipid II flippase